MMLVPDRLTRRGRPLAVCCYCARTFGPLTPGKILSQSRMSGVTALSPCCARPGFQNEIAGRCDWRSACARWWWHAPSHHGQFTLLKAPSQRSHAGMATLGIDGSDLVVRLSAMEKIGAPQAQAHRCRERCRGG